jgi:hypothetical protein
MPLVHLWKPDQMGKGKQWSFQVLSAKVPKKGEIFTFFFTIEMNEVLFPAMFVGKRTICENNFDHVFSSLFSELFCFQR